jgi:hypothetical protein
MILVDPNADHIRKKRFFKYSQRIECINEKFGGKSGYKDVNNIIATKLGSQI